MKVVASNSEADLARERAKDHVDWAIRELTANLFRVTRGAGKPWDVGTQAVALVEAMRAFWEATDTWPFDELHEMLALDRRKTTADADENAAATRYAEAAIIDGVLQVAASTLLGQRTQISRGESEMYDGINALERARTEERRKWAAVADTPARRAAAGRAALVEARLRAKKAKAPRKP